MVGGLQEAELERLVQGLLSGGHAESWKDLTAFSAVRLSYRVVLAPRCRVRNGGDLGLRRSQSRFPTILPICTQTRARPCATTPIL